MKRTLVLSLEIEIDELSPEDQAEQAEILKCEIQDLKTVSGIDPQELANEICETLLTSQELHDGSMIHCQVTGAVIKSAEFLV